MALVLIQLHPQNNFSPPLISEKMRWVRAWYWLALKIISSEFFEILWLVRRYSLGGASLFVPKLVDMIWSLLIKDSWVTRLPLFCEKPTKSCQSEIINNLTNIKKHKENFNTSNSLLLLQKNSRKILKAISKIHEIIFTSFHKFS